MLLRVGWSKSNLLEVQSLNAFMVLVKPVHTGASSRLACRLFNGQNASWGLSVKPGLGRHGAGGCGGGSALSLQPSVASAPLLCWQAQPAVAASLLPGCLVQTCGFGSLQPEEAGEGWFCEFLMVLLPSLVSITAEPVGTWFSENLAL